MRQRHLTQGSTATASQGAGRLLGRTSRRGARSPRTVSLKGCDAIASSLNLPTRGLRHPCRVATGLYCGRYVWLYLRKDRIFEFWNISSRWKILGLDLVTISFVSWNLDRRLHPNKMSLCPEIVKALGVNECWSSNIQARVLCLKYWTMTANFVSEPGHLFWSHLNATKYISIATILKTYSLGRYTFRICNT